MLSPLAIILGDFSWDQIRNILEFFRSIPDITRLLICVGFCALVFATKFIPKKVVTENLPQTVQPAAPLVPLKATALYLKYRTLPFLPLEVPADQTIYVQYLKPGNDAGLSTFSTGDKPDLFPDKNFPFGQELITVNVKNDGDSNLLDLAFRYSVKFYPADKNGGTNFDHVAPVHSGTFIVRTPTVRPGQTFTFYLINCSKYSAKIEYPTVANGRPFPEETTRDIKINRETTGKMDEMPEWALGPTHYQKWLDEE